MAVALLGFPFAAFWVGAPNPFTEGTREWRAFSWLFLDLSPLLFVLAFLVALLSALVDALKRRWLSIPQCLAEMIVCFTCFMVIPVF
jgi:hypothetical protein